MSRVGWVILSIVLLSLIGFLSVVRVGGLETVPGGSARWLSIRSIPALSPAKPHPGLLSVPVAGVERSTIRDSWGDARGDGTREHHGTDIIASAGATVLAAAPGTIEKLFQSTLGGTTLYERSADRRWLYYYAHLQGYAPGVHEGQWVRPGDPLGYVGDTGDAGPGNFHLHFGLSRVEPDGHWWQGRDVDPFPLLAGRRAAR